MIPPDDLWELPHRHIGQQVLYYERLGSTSDAIAELAADPVHAGTVILAGEQTGGRGQYGRTWLAPPGTSVLMSVLLFPPPELRSAALLTAWAAVSASETIQKATGRQARIKWPNDVLLNDRKVCGVLIEQGRAVIAGIGLNVNQSDADFEAAGLPQAGSLAAVTGQSFDVMQVARMLLADLDRVFGLLVGGDLTTLEAAWKEWLGLLGCDVVAETFDGTNHRGRLRACGFSGLAIERPGGELTLLTPEQVKALGESR